VASRGRCGFIHLDSGRVCQLPHRHRGPCDRGLNRLAKCVEESVVSLATSYAMPKVACVGAYAELLETDTRGPLNSCAAALGRASWPEIDLPTTLMLARY
jgi:hypothetical protein